MIIFGAQELRNTKALNCAALAGYDLRVSKVHITVLQSFNYLLTVVKP